MMEAFVLYSGPEQHEAPLALWSLLEIVSRLAELATGLIAGSENCELPLVLAVDLQGLIAAVPEVEAAVTAFDTHVQAHDFSNTSGEPDPSLDRAVPLISGPVERIGRNLCLVMAGLSLLYDQALREATAMDAATIALTAGHARVLPFTATVVSLVEVSDTE